MAAVLVGRGDELALISAFVERTRTAGEALFLFGEPGAGKTVLLDAAAEAATQAGFLVLRAAGVEFEADLSFSALHQVLLPLLGEFGWLSAGHRDALKVALGYGEGPPPDRLLMSTATLTVLRQAAAASPVLVIVDKVTLLIDPRKPQMPGPAAGRYLVSVLRKIGYRASLRAITSPQTYGNTTGNSRDRIQAGEFIWGADYPAPWDFFGLLFSCQSFLPATPANINDSEFCSPRIDAQVRQALAAQARSPNAARLRWANIDRAITDQALWVPLYNPRAMIVLSARVGNYQFHPLFGLLIDQLWVR